MVDDICDSFLLFAEGAFRTALSQVTEQERCSGSGADVAGLWERGQHFLLRGRAHHNIGLAMYELARHAEVVPASPSPVQHGSAGKRTPKELYARAIAEFDAAESRARSLRRHAASIHGHANAKDASIQNDNWMSWADEATVHSFRALQLECVAIDLRISCSWKLGRRKDAEEGFDGFFATYAPADVPGFDVAEGLSSLDVAEALDGMYGLAMRHAESSIQSLEELTKQRAWKVEVGEELFRQSRKAMERASSLSDLLLDFAKRRCPDFVFILFH